ncbi:MAG: CopG family transcriptional regulator [Devosia sp.]|nr:CopG family transcriptional regulator [Devosia sp.]
MNTLTLKIPESLDAALQVASAQRHISKSAVVREALEKALAEEIRQVGPAAKWVSRWRGKLSSRSPALDDQRTAHILNKHAR